MVYIFSRREFIKTFGAVLLAGAGGGFLWRALRRRDQETALAGPRPLLALFLLSDIHLAEDSPTVDRLHLALEDLSRFNGPIDTIVLGGDLVDSGRESDYAALSKILAAYDLPKAYGLMGNHEYYHIWYNQAGEWSTETGPNGKTDAESRERFMQFMGLSDRPYSDAWVGGVHLIMLSQETYVQEDPTVGEGAWYSDEQLAWLAEVMRPHADGSPALVFIHQPLPPAGSDGGAHRVIRARAFRSVLEPCPNVIVLSGHTHRSLETEGRYTRDTTFHWFQNASVGKTRGNASVATPVQGLYIQVYPGKVVLKGREFSNRTWIKAAEWTVDLEGLG